MPGESLLFEETYGSLMMARAVLLGLVNALLGCV